MEQTLLDWFAGRSFTLLIGNPPYQLNQKPEKAHPLFHLPLALRELYTIHSGLSSWQATIFSPEQIETLLSRLFIDMSADRENHYLNLFHTRNYGLLPRQFVELASDISGNASVFDLDLLDTRLDPQVAEWDHETWQVGKRQPFWTWFDEHITTLFGLSAEEKESC